MSRFLEKLHLPSWLIGLLAFLFILRIPSFFEPYYYGDEMIYLSLGEGIRQGIPLYGGLHDNKPPLIYILSAIAGNLVNLKIILAFWVFTTVVFFWKLSKALFPENSKLQKVATLIFGIFSTIPLLEGNIANAELFMMGPIILAFLLLFTKRPTPKTLILSGLAFSFASLFKIPAALDLPVIFVFWLITMGLKKENFITIFKRSLYLLLGFLIPILLTFVWYYFHGALKEYIVAAFAQNVGYLSSFRSQDTIRPFWLRNAPLVLRGLILASGLILLYWKRNKLSEKFVFITTWLLFTLFAVTLSERPYPHYLLQSLPPISLLFAILFTQKNKEQTLVIIPLALTFLIPVYFRFYHYPTFSYYSRFAQFATGQITKEQYFSRFDSNVNRNYKVSEFIDGSIRKDQRIFVWGDSSVVYALSRHLPPIKYVADYHINDFANKTEVAKDLDGNSPKFIILLRSSAFSEILPLLKNKYILINVIDGAEVWSLLTNES